MGKDSLSQVWYDDNYLPVVVVKLDMEAGNVDLDDELAAVKDVLVAVDECNVAMVVEDVVTTEAAMERDQFDWKWCLER